MSRDGYKIGEKVDYHIAQYQRGITEILTYTSITHSYQWKDKIKKES